MYVFVDVCPKKSKKCDAMLKLTECVEQYCLENRLFDDTCDITDNDSSFDLCERDFVRGICRTSSVRDVKYRLRYNDDTISMDSSLCSDKLCDDTRHSDSNFTLSEKDFVHGICRASSVIDLSVCMNSTDYSEERLNCNVHSDDEQETKCDNDIVNSVDGYNTSIWSGIGVSMLPCDAQCKQILFESYCYGNRMNVIADRYFESVSVNYVSGVISGSSFDNLNDSDNSVKSFEIVDFVVSDVVQAFVPKMSE